MLAKSRKQFWPQVESPSTEHAYLGQLCKELRIPDVEQAMPFSGHQAQNDPGWPPFPAGHMLADSLPAASQVTLPVVAIWGQKHIF